MIRRLLVLAFIGLSAAPAMADSAYKNAILTYSGATVALSANGYFFTSGPLFAVPTASLQFGLPYSISYGVKGALFGSGPATVVDSTAGTITKGFYNGACVGFGSVGCPNAFPIGAAATGSMTGSGAGQVATRDDFMQDEGWHNVCVRQTATSTAFYVDGQQVAQNASVPPLTISTSYWSVASPVTQFNTQLRDIRVYSADIGSGGCALLGQLASHGLTPSTGSLQNNLAAHWPMGNCNGTGCADSSGNANDLIYNTGTPACTISSPANGFSGVSGSVNLQATCTDTIAVVTVRWFVDGAYQGTSTVSPYTTVWDTTKFIDGSHTVLIEAVNASSAVGSQTSVGTTSNGVSARTIYFDPVAGNDANSCLTTLLPCKTLAGVQAIINTNPLHGGDSILQKAGTNLNIASLAQANTLLLKGPLCDAFCPPGNQTVYPGGAITLSTYGGSGNCHILAGVTTDCASITLNADAAGPRNRGIFNVANVPNLVVSNFRLSADQPLAYGCPGSGDGCNVVFNYATDGGYYNGSSVSTAVIQNNEIIGGFEGLYVSGFVDQGKESGGNLCGVTVQDNYVHGSAISSPESVGILIQHTFCGSRNLVAVSTLSNYTNNMGGITGNANQAGSGLIYIDGFINVVDNFNATTGDGYNVSTCGDGYGNWWFAGISVIAKGNESWNHFPHVGAVSGCDVGAFDFDLGLSQSFGEYNYGHTTWGPTIGVFNGAAPGFQNGNNTMVYNIFENGGMYCPNDGTCAMTFPATSVAGPINWYNNTTWSGYNGTNDITNGHQVRVAAQAYPGFSCSTANGWINPVINNISVVSTFTGTSSGDLPVADMVSGGFSSSSQNCTTITHKNNDYFPIGGGTPTFFKVLTATTYSSVAAWNAASGDTGVDTDPGFTGAGGTGVVCYPGIGVSGIPVQPGSIPCPTNYELPHGNGFIGAGLDLTHAPYSLTLPSKDFYTNNIPNGVLTGYNLGAFGAAP